MSQENEYVTYRGARMVKGWPDKIRVSQYVKSYKIGGRECARVPHDGDDACSDCAVLKGELQVPGCDTERCPICDGQVFACGCPNEDQPVI